MPLIPAPATTSIGGPPAHRFLALDSVRGIAAVAVLLFHCWVAGGGHEYLNSLPATQALGPATWLLVRATTALVDMGRAAVMLFFVLSGFVLAGSLLRNRVSYAEFIARRLLRILPALLVVLLLSYGLHRWLGPLPRSDSGFIQRIAAPDLSLLGLLKALTLYGTTESLNLDLAVWSLVHELRVSLLFPLLLLALQLAPRLTLAGCTALSAACTVLMYVTLGRPAYGFLETTFLQTVVVTGYFVIFFAAGAWLAIRRVQITHWCTQLTTLQRWALLTLCVVIFLKADHGAVIGASGVDYLHGLASLLLIALILGTPSWTRSLLAAPLPWIGRISYSLYLVHLPVLYTVIALLGPHHGWRIAVLVIPVSLLLAHILAETVEYPCMQMAAGKRLTPPPPLPNATR